MNPFYFGDPQAPLYGVYHPPRERDRGLAVVLCYPIGAEYMRSHRAFRQLTTFLTREGVHVLRFDWLGTGDSAGDGNDASLDRWIQNLGTAIDEMKDTSGIDSVSLAGLRLGGTLALTGGVGRDDVDRIVLWDPVGDGADFLKQAIDSRPEDAEALGYPAGTVGLSGFPLTPALRSDLQALNLSTLPAPAEIPLRVVVSSASPEWEASVKAWAAEGASATFRHVPDEGDWAVGDRFGSALIPQTIIRGVVDALTAGGGR